MSDSSIDPFSPLQYVFLVEVFDYNDKDHKAEWKTGSTFHIRCEDEYGNQPNPNECSVIIRPFEIS